MIIRRHLYPQNRLGNQKVYDSGMEIYKKTTATNSISGGNTIVRDVEDLLKPLQKPKLTEESNGQNQFSKERTERNLWRNEEVMEMLYTMQQVKALEKLNDKTVKSENVFKDVEVIMHRNGYVKKSHVQIWTKWKFLKSTYMTSRRNGLIPRIVPPQIYDMIHQMITVLNQNLGDSCSSADGDSSSVNGMVISGVEAGISDIGVTNDDDEDTFGMAHPIFGFRLGMVKSEPEDTSYEPVDNNHSDKVSLEEKLSPSKSYEEVKGEDNYNEANSDKEPQPTEKVLEIPHRGRGRPPKYPPAATATTNNKPSPTAMPPLRVAPFAKSINTLNNTAANRPPPPLTVHSAGRIQVDNFSNSKNGNTGKFAQPKLIPKPARQQHSPPIQSPRITKELTPQSRSSSTPSPSYPKMKQIPMRKTPYSLRPDRAIPDLEASLSPPPSAIERTSSKKLEEVPTTKHLVMQSSSNNFQNVANRKRRADGQDSIPAQQRKYDNIINEEENSPKSHNIEYDKKFGKVLQNVIIDLSTSLRKMQSEMMRDFFNKQNELLEREHKFQMQQDHVIMQAFQEQTQEIMHSVKDLVGSIMTRKNYHQNDVEQNIKETKTNRIKRRMQQIDEMESHQIENNNYNDDENEREHEDRSEEQEEEQEREDVYTDDEQQNQMEEQDENDPEDMEDNAQNERNGGNEEHEDEDQ